MIGCTRVKVVDDLANHTTIVETKRERGDVFMDLVKIAREANRKREDALKMSVHLAADLIIVHYHTTTTSEVASKFNAEVIALGNPIRDVERILWPRPRGGAA